MRRPARRSTPGDDIERYTDVALRLGLTVAALGSVIMLAIMLIDLSVPVRWNWYNALAFFCATTLLAATRYLRGLADGPRTTAAR